MTTSSTQQEVDLTPARAILERREKALPSGQGPRSAASGDDLIPLLQEIQNAYGYLPEAALSWVSGQTGIPTSRIYGVITFYAQFYTEPHGKHTVRCCRGTACHVKGGKKVLQAVKSTLMLEEGRTSKDMLFSLETVACLGACALSPVMMVGSTYYGKMTPRRAQQILGSLKEEAR